MTTTITREVEQYLRTILWAETDESEPNGGDPLDQNYDNRFPILRD